MENQSLPTARKKKKKNTDLDPDPLGSWLALQALLWPRLDGLKPSARRSVWLQGKPSPAHLGLKESPNSLPEWMAQNKSKLLVYH